MGQSERINIEIFMEWTKFCDRISDQRDPVDLWSTKFQESEAPTFQLFYDSIMKGIPVVTMKCLMSRWIISQPHAFSNIPSRSKLCIFLGSIRDSLPQKSCTVP